MTGRALLDDDADDAAIAAHWSANVGALDEGWDMGGGSFEGWAEPSHFARPSERSENTATLAVVLLGVAGTVIVAFDTDTVRSVIAAVSRWFA